MTDSAFPGGFDDPRLDEALMHANWQDDLDGTGTWKTSSMLRLLQTGVYEMQNYFPRVVGKTTGATVSNTSSATSVLNATLSVPASLLRAGSQLEVCHRGIATLNSGTPALAFTAILGGVTYALGTTTGLTANANAHQYVMRLLFTANTIGATGDIHLQGEWRITAATTNSFDVNSVSVFGGGTGTIDTTSAMTFDLKTTMSVANASNTVVSGLTTIAHTPFIG